MAVAQQPGVSWNFLKTTAEFTGVRGHFSGTGVTLGSLCHPENRCPCSISKMLLFLPFLCPETPSQRESLAVPKQGQDNSPVVCLGTAYLSSPAKIHRQVETVSGEMSTCLHSADVSLEVSRTRAFHCDPREVSS